MISKSSDENTSLTDFQKVGDILKHPLHNNVNNVNNVDNNNSNNVETSNVNVGSKDGIDETEYIARNLAVKLDDLKNLNYYRKCAREHKPEFLYECLSITMAAKKEGIIRKTPAKYFVGVLKQKSGKQ